MEKLLKRIKSKVWHVKDGLRIEGLHDRLGGDVTNIHGDVTNIRGCVTDVRGDVSNIIGDVTRVSGDLDNCGITPEEREKGVRIEDLIAVNKIDN
jgi:hypothetical protein